MRLTGIMYSRQKTYGKILSITYPENYPEIFVVNAQSLGKANSFSIYGNTFSVFAEDEIIYPGQPLFAVFGPNTESVELFCRAVKVEIQEAESSIAPEPKTFEWNTDSTKQYFDSQEESLIAISSDFAIKRHSEMLFSDKKISANFNQGVLTVETETFWPFKIKQTIAESFDLNPDNIIINTLDSYPGFDQLAFKPIPICIVAAYAAIKNNCQVTVAENLTAFHPAIRYNIDSIVNKETSNIVATKANVSVDIGAYFVLEDELATTIFAGLVSLYRTDDLEVKIQLFRTNNCPSNLYRGLGFAPSVAAMEHHATIVANTLGIMPDTWRLENINTCEESELKDILTVSDVELLSKAISENSKSSEFRRKNFAYNQKHISGHISPVLNYTRGIGIAGSGGISGFSSLFTKQKNCSIEATLNEDNTLELNCGIYANEEIQGNWKSIVKETFPEISLRNILIKQMGYGITDLGPAILSRSETVIPDLIEKACLELSQKRDEKVSYPIKSAPEFTRSSKNKTLYDVNSFGSVVIDLFIDPVQLNPVVYIVDAVFNFGKIRNREQLKKNLRQIISQTIKDACPDASIGYTLNLNIVENPKIQSDFSISMARGITMAALSSALSQALKHNIYRLPVSSEDILGIIRMKEEEK